jgi:hypothetical protein
VCGGGGGGGVGGGGGKTENVAKLFLSKIVMTVFNNFEDV